MSQFHNFTMNNIDGDPVSFDRYEDKVCLVVNVASECGYTPQYDGLQKLQERHESDGLRVLGFPCNQFADEEPGTEDEIKTFCKTNYGVTFDMFEKIEVKGESACELYQWLTSSRNPWGPHRVRWNFQKYLIDREGTIAHTFDPIVEPNQPYLLDRLTELL